MLQQWRRDWRTIAFAAAVGVVVLLVIVITASLLSGGLGWREREECATMEDILAGKYAARKFNGTWITGTEPLRFVSAAFGSEFGSSEAASSFVFLLSVGFPFGCMILLHV